MAQATAEQLRPPGQGLKAMQPYELQYNWSRTVQLGLKIELPL